MSKVVDERSCRTCGRQIASGRRPDAIYCPGDTCKQRAWRRTRKGLAANAMPNGRRGRVALGEPTKAERQAQAAEIVDALGGFDELLTFLRATGLKREFVAALRAIPPESRREE